MSPRLFLASGSPLGRQPRARAAASLRLIPLSAAALSGESIVGIPAAAAISAAELEDVILAGAAGAAGCGGVAATTDVAATTAAAATTGAAGSSCSRRMMPGTTGSRSAEPGRA